MSAPIDVAEIRERAARLIERGWCQGAIARDANGVAVQPNSPDARSEALALLMEGE